MLVVLAQRHDTAARRLVAGWPGDAGILTCRDLSRRGWRYTPGGPSGMAVVDGQLVPADTIEGVLVRLPYALETELGVIAEEDRAYVASEMTAYLSAWLSELACPVLNRPAPMHLTGPDWPHERWLHAAARLGIATTTSRRSVPSAQTQADGFGNGPVTVTVIAGHALGDGDREAARAAVALARAAGVAVLRAHFADTSAGGAFTGADYWVDVDDPAVSTALQFCVGSGCP